MLRPIKKIAKNIYKPYQLIIYYTIINYRMLFLGKPTINLNRPGGIYEETFLSYFIVIIISCFRSTKA